MASELTTHDQIFNIRRFPPGRMYTVLLAMRLLAEREQLAELLGRIDDGLIRVKRYLALRRQRQNRRLGRGGGKARKIDRIIDDDIAEIAHIAGREADRFPDTEAGKAALALVDAFFTQGVTPITQIPYDEELAVVEHMIPLMRREHGRAIALLGIDRLVSRVEEHLPKYREALAPTDEVSPGELGAAYEAMQVGFMQIIGWVAVMIGDIELRDALLGPMQTHDAQLAAIHAARRRGGSAPSDLPPEDVTVEGVDGLDDEAIEALDAAEQAEAAERAEVEAAAEAADEAAAPEAPVEGRPEGDAPVLRPLTPGGGDR